jgi:hypothetical protein
VRRDPFLDLETWPTTDWLEDVTLDLYLAYHWSRGIQTIRPSEAYL